MKRNNTHLAWFIDDDSVSNMNHEQFFIENFQHTNIRLFDEAEEAFGN